VKLWNVVIIGLSLIILNCDTSNIISSNYCNSNGYLARGDDLAQIEPSPPSGTQYGTGNSTWTSSGSEYLQDEYWVKNIYSSTFKIAVFELVSITYDSPEYIHVNNPVNVTYLHVTMGWISLTSSGYITTESLKVNTGGSCTVAGEDEIEIGGLPGNT
jgi:hypothetical protein